MNERFELIGVRAESKRFVDALLKRGDAAALELKLFFHAGEFGGGVVELPLGARQLGIVRLVMV
ncbi:hypothetical protein D3C76_1836980 [compost metagenome]